ncbi:MAG: ornithine carbamoyltransferase [bacterium]|jgi:ornithine carbamoyltransferase
MKETKHLITWKDWTDEEIQDVLKRAKQVKDERLYYVGHAQNRSLVMLFQKTSTRTRVSFEAAMTELGGHAIFMDWNTTNFKLTKIRYEAKYLSRNASVVMARMKKHEELLELKSGLSIPLINGCCNMYHPCQAMADMLTILEDRGDVKGAKLTYLGVHNNVVNSLMAVCSALGVHLTLVTPIAEESSIDAEIKQKIQERGLLTETLNKEEAVKGADYVYTDTWVDMEFFDNPEYQEMKEERIRIMLPYQINSELLKNSNAKILHDMPIHPGYEISEDVIETPRSLIFDQAENRLDVQKAIILRLLDEHSDYKE